MLEAADKVAEEHERNVRLFLLLLSGLRALDDAPPDPAAVAESFLLKLLSLSGFHPSLSACAVCGAPGPHERFAAGQGGVVCAADAEHDAGRVSWPSVHWLDQVARLDLTQAGYATPPTVVRREARAILYGYTEYHLERRMRSFSLLARQPEPAAVVIPDPVPASSP
jgi:DNA repair protein RecO (recombination protein O)